MADPRHRLGLEAEAAVARWLAGEGWVVLAQRWRVAGGELDLVMRDPDGVLVGVEVRARRTSRAGSAAESVGRSRVVRLRHALMSFAAQADVRALLRVDLVTLVPARDLDPAVERRWRVTRVPAIDAW